MVLSSNFSEMNDLNKNIGLHLQATQFNSDSSLAIVLKNENNYVMPMPISFYSNEKSNSELFI